LINNKDKIKDLTINLFNTKGVAAFTGRASTKVDLENRINYFKEVFKSVL